MATAEQGARIVALETQLQIESARAQKAEQGRSALIQTLGAMRTDCGGAMVDTKAIGQPDLLKRTADQDFGEWTHKVPTFVLARFGDSVHQKFMDVSDVKVTDEEGFLSCSMMIKAKNIIMKKQSCRSARSMFSPLRPDNGTPLHDECVFAVRRNVICILNSTRDMSRIGHPGNILLTLLDVEWIHAWCQLCQCLLSAPFVFVSS